MNHAVGDIAAAAGAREEIWSLRLAAAARFSPHRIAVRGGAGGLDYAALHASVERLAAGLQQAGVGEGDVVAITAARDPDCVALILATLRAGAVCLPLDSGYPPARLQMMLEEAQPRLCVADVQERMPIASSLPYCSFRELEALAEGRPAVTTLANPQLAYVLFTSGSSGRPKGVAMRRSALEHLIEWHATHPRLGVAARTLQFAPLSFDVSFQEILSTIATGGTLVLPGDSERRDPYALLALIARERIERLFLPYVAVQALAEAVAAGGGAPTSLGDVITAGEQLRITPSIRALFATLPGCVLHNHYGPTETHVVTAHELVGDSAAWPELPPIGRPLPHVEVRIVDEALGEVADGDEGELLLGGDCLAAGYIHRPELTAERFIESGSGHWYRSGDRARRLGDGTLEYLGRIDAQIKLSGYRIEPAEIEVVLTRHPAVAEAVVVPAGEAANRRLVAHVVPRDMQMDETILAERLREECRIHLAEYLVPQQFVLHAALPLTASGKIDRGELARGMKQAPLEWPESAPLEQQLAALWKQLLGIASLDAQTNLFDTGARSLTVVRALTELRRHGYRSLSVAQIYEHPSIAQQAALLRGDQDTVPSSTAVADALSRGRNQRAALTRFAPRQDTSR